MLTDYAEVAEGLRVVETDTVKYKIVLDRYNSGLWHIEVSVGSVPVALRGRYTSHDSARLDIKKYVDQMPNRQIIYKKLPKKTEE